MSKYPGRKFSLRIFNANCMANKTYSLLLSIRKPDGLASEKQNVCIGCTMKIRQVQEVFCL